MRSSVRVALTFFVAVTNVTCSVNILENFADKNSNQALFIDAKKLINDGDYDAALAKLGLINGAFATDRKVLTLKASAYGGKCGLVFLPFVEAIGAMGSNRLFPFLLGYFRSGATTAKIDACIAAEETLESIGTTSQRTNDENMLLVLVAFAKIGNILSYYADVNQDGTTTNNYDICAIAGVGVRTAGGDVPVEDLNELTWSLVSAINNITAVTSSVDLGDASLTDINTACSQLEAALGVAYNFCATPDKSSFTDQHRQGARALIKEDSVVGLDTLQAGCDGGVTTCNCGL